MNMMNAEEQLIAKTLKEIGETLDPHGKTSQIKAPLCVSFRDPASAELKSGGHEQCAICHDPFTNEKKEEAKCSRPLIYSTTQCPCKQTVGIRCLAGHFWRKRECFLCHKDLESEWEMVERTVGSREMGLGRSLAAGHHTYRGFGWGQNAVGTTSAEGSGSSSYRGGDGNAAEREVNPDAEGSDDPMFNPYDVLFN